jgi:hypothetical protein
MALIKVGTRSAASEESVVNQTFSLTTSLFFPTAFKA